MSTVVTEVLVRDVRFPTSLEKDGSDAMNKAPDYSCPYVILKTDGPTEGHGITFTVGKGNDIVVCAINALSGMVKGRKLDEIYSNFGSFWRELTSEDQIRWVGPEKGVTHLAVAAIINALWDLWAKIENKPLWKLLVDMEPEVLVSTIDFRYINDVLTREEAIDLLKTGTERRSEREAKMRETGYPAYTTSCGWLGYSDDKIRKLCREAIKQGFTMFKIKVGGNLEDDIRRCAVIREEIGEDRILMTDANQRWETYEAIEWMKKLAKFKIFWIEEPTSPDDVLGHARISKELHPLGIGVATGEQCQNRIVFKQLLQADAIQFCQIDACRLGGVNENLAVILMAAKFGVPICPHGGGVGLCELVQHLSIFDYITVTGSLENRVVEYVDHLHEHFKNPVIMKNAHYQLPGAPGYSIEMKEESLTDYEFPNGRVWQQLIEDGVYSV